MRTKKMLPWILGGVIAVSALAWGLSTTVGKAAEQDAEPMKQHEMHQKTMQDGQHMAGQMDPKMMQDMMKDPAMQEKCLEMLQQPEMQSRMKDMLQNPEMQAMLKDMMQKDGQFHKTMLDLVNSVEMDESHEHGVTQATQPIQIPVSGNEHASHH